MRNNYNSSRLQKSVECLIHQAKFEINAGGMLNQGNMACDKWLMAGDSEFFQMMYFLRQSIVQPNFFIFTLFS